jgi:hypothetical protein
MFGTCFNALRAALALTFTVINRDAENAFPVHAGYCDSVLPTNMHTDQTPLTFFIIYIASGSYEVDCFIWAGLVTATTCQAEFRFNHSWDEELTHGKSPLSEKFQKSMRLQLESHELAPDLFDEIGGPVGPLI